MFAFRPYGVTVCTYIVGRRAIENVAGSKIVFIHETERETRGDMYFGQHRHPIKFHQPYRNLILCLEQCVAVVQCYFDVQVLSAF